MIIRIGAAVACLVGAASLLPLLPVWGAQAGAAGATTPFQAILLVPADDQDYIVTRIPAGKTAVLTDVIAYNSRDGLGHKVADETERYLWLGGYVERRSIGLVNRLRVLGNASEQWRLETGLRLTGAPELVVSSEKGAPGAGSSLVVVTGYLE